jgi:hypothetical protein
VADNARPRRRSFREDVRDLMLVGSILAAMVWALCWLPLGFLLVAGQPIDDALQSPWLASARDVGPSAAAAIDPLLPTLVTVLVALSISEIWRVAPEELLSLGSVLAVLGIAWAMLAITSLVTAPGETTGEAIAGVVLAFVIAITAGWMRHVSPVGLRNQLKALVDAEATLSARRDRYEELLVHRGLSVARPGRVRLLWNLPALVALAVTVPAIVVAGSPGYVATVGFSVVGLNAFALYGLGSAVKDPVRGDDASGVFARTSAGVVTALVAVGTLLLTVTNLDGVSWYWAILSATGGWTLLTWLWKQSPYLRTFLMSNRSSNDRRLHRVVATRNEVQEQLNRVRGVPPEGGRLARAIRELTR